jgi:carbonic anhydrase
MTHDGAMPPNDFSPNADELLRNNAAFAAHHTDRQLVAAPRRRLAVVSCMDSRMDMFQMLGLQHGEAHIVRNAGATVTDDVIRSLSLSQRTLGTREIIVIQHTECGLFQLDEPEFKATIESETGVRPWWALESFTDVHANVRQSMARLLLSPFILHKRDVRGFVYDVHTGRLEPVEPDPRHLPPTS